VGIPRRARKRSEDRNASPNRENARFTGLSRVRAARSKRGTPDAIHDDESGTPHLPGWNRTALIAGGGTTP